MTPRYFLRVASARIAARRRYDLSGLRAVPSAFNRSTINSLTQFDNDLPSSAAADSARFFTPGSSLTATTPVFSALFMLTIRLQALTNIDATVYIQTVNIRQGELQ